MQVRPCEPEDLAPLDEALPLEGPYGHQYRFRGQADGRWLYLLALAPAPIGSCLVQWDGPTDYNVRRTIPNCTEITSVYVVEQARGQGAGRALLAAAEHAAASRGSNRIGIGVGDDNPRARRLYEALGYASSGSRYRVEYDYLGETGEAAHTVEAGDFLVKNVDVGTNE